MLPLADLLGIRNQGGAARRRPPYFGTKRLALLGNTNSIAYAPWFDARWTLAAHPCCRPKCQREPDWYFDLHRPECFRTQQKRWNPEYYTWLQRLQTPIFMQENWPDVPMSVRYPLERILAEFRSYHTNHCTYMIALAMTEGVTHIGLYGCEYQANSEYAIQRDSLTYWLGRFEQAGGTVVIPPRQSTLLRRPWYLYGYESHDEHGKLIPEYRAPEKVTVPKADGTQEERTLVPISLTKGEGRPPLMAPPPGVSIAWERSGHTILH